MNRIVEEENQARPTCHSHEKEKLEIYKELVKTKELLMHKNTAQLCYACKTKGKI